MRFAEAFILIIANLCAGGLFGFFFTMSHSIMTGLDQTPAYSALIANQMIGRATQQSLFFVLLVGTPISIIIGSVLAWRLRHKATSSCLLVGLLGWTGMLAITLIYNVPLNQILDGLTLEPNMKEAIASWQAYSIDWQIWNHVRVALSAITAIAVTSGILTRKI